MVHADRAQPNTSICALRAIYVALEITFYIYVFFTVFAVTIFSGDIFVPDWPTVGEHAATSADGEDKEFLFNAGLLYTKSVNGEREAKREQRMALFCSRQ